MRITLFALFPLFLIASVAAQGEEEEGMRLPPVNHAATLKECSACHMVYPPQMLPARSWQAILTNLSNHFDEDATVTAEIQKDILTYLVANAADSPAAGAGRKFMRRLDEKITPLRITETPFWIRAHDEIPSSAFSRPDVKSRSNCQACHRTADKGEFFEVEE